MSVPKNKRKPSKFDTAHHLLQVRKEVTSLAMNDFAFSETKYEKQIESFRKSLKTNSTNKEEVVQRMKKKKDELISWYLDYEKRKVLDMVSNMTREFTIANSIFPSETEAKVMEYIERRRHLNEAIGECKALKQELQSIFTTLPVNINKFQRFADMIDELIKMMRGVRQADNRFLKHKNKNKQLSNEYENYTHKYNIQNINVEEEQLKTGVQLFTEEELQTIKEMQIEEQLQTKE